MALIDAGAPMRSKSGSGRARSARPASWQGVGVPQLTAILEAAEAGARGRRAGDSLTGA